MKDQNKVEGCLKQPVLYVAKIVRRAFLREVTAKVPQHCIMHAKTFTWPWCYTTLWNCTKTTEKENNHLNAHNASQRFFKNFTSSEVKELFCQPIVQLCAHSHIHGGPQGGPGPLSALRQLRWTGKKEKIFWRPAQCCQHWLEKEKGLKVRWRRVHGSIGQLSPLAGTFQMYTIFCI